jgi:uncharacterized protein YjdB
LRNSLFLPVAAIVAACGGGYDAGSSTTGTSGGTQAITVSVTPTTALMAIGDRITLTATVSGGATGTARTVTWSSSDNTRASVNPSGDVTALAKGNVVVTATSTANPQKSAAAAITISP